MTETIIETPRFNEDISFGSSGGPGFNTDVITVNSGVETRNVNWTQARHTYNVAFGIRNQTYLDSLVEFFQAMKGKAYGFRYKDWSDYSSNNTATPTQADQTIGTGDSSDGTDGTDTFQIIKTYQVGAQSTIRVINKIVALSLLVEVDSTLQVENVDYTVDYNTGIITFLPTFIPQTGLVIKCGYQFDVPVRFDTDELSINLEMYEHGTTDVPLVELRI